MEATVVRIGDSLGFKVSEKMITNFGIKIGSKIEVDFNQNGSVFLRKKSAAREGWENAFAVYASEGEDEFMLPDFFDTETNTFLE